MLTLSEELNKISTLRFRIENLKLDFCDLDLFSEAEQLNEILRDLTNRINALQIRINAGEL
jgi:hypothetical protein